MANKTKQTKKRLTLANSSRKMPSVFQMHQSVEFCAFIAKVSENIKRTHDPCWFEKMCLDIFRKGTNKLAIFFKNWFKRKTALGNY